MVKGTNKFWKGMALLLALCMLPTAALATEEATGATVTVAGVTESEKDISSCYAEGVFTIDANIGVATNDVTILAFRATTDAKAFPTDAELNDSVVYIDQVTSDENGDVTFTFKPRAVDPAKGGYVHIYVGGEDMTGEPVWAYANVPYAAPVLGLPTAWYTGQALAFTAEEDAEYLAAWKDALTDIKVTGTKANDEAAVEATDIILPADITVADNKVSIETDALKSVTKIEFISGGNFAVAVADFGTALVRKDIPAGTFGTMTSTEGVIISSEGEKLEFKEPADAEGVTDTTWSVGAADEANFKWAYEEGDTAKEDLDYAEFDTAVDGDFTLPLLGIGAEKLWVKLEIAGCETAYYGPYTIKSKVQSAIEALAAPAVSYGEGATVPYTTENAAEQGAYYQDIPASGADLEEFLDAEFEAQKRMYGKATVVLPAEGANGTTVSWQMKEGEGEFGEASTTITRNAKGLEAKQVVFKATVSDGTSEDVKEFSAISVQPLGVSGVEVSITLPKELAVTGTTVKLEGDEEYILETGATGVDGEVTFAVPAIPAGNYTLIITRPGYKVKTINVVVAEANVVVTAPTDMVFGNITGPNGVLDEVINFRDYDALLLVLGDAAKYDVMYDYNADGLVNFRDYDELLLNLD